MQKILLSLMSMAPLMLAAQNLVLNPGFEIVKPNASIKPCQHTRDAKAFTNAAVNWSAFSWYTPDLVIWNDSLVNCPYPKPHSGNNMAGIILYHPGLDSGYGRDYHELIQGKLKVPLKPGTTYRVSYWVQQNDSTAVKHLRDVFGRYSMTVPVSCNNFGVWFTEGAIKPTEDFNKTVLEFGIVPHVVDTQVVRNKLNTWVQVSGTFKADKPYTYFIIGNFSDDSQTRTFPDLSEDAVMRANSEKKFFQRVKRIGYYCIDDVSVEEYKGEDPGKQIAEALKTKKTYTLTKVLFKTAEAVVLPESFEELDALATFLKEQPELRMEISGHTDHIGEAQANALLSEQRAKAVCQYLAEKGVASKRLVAKGYGESKPVADNETEAGRKKNRRVECRVLEGK